MDISNISAVITGGASGLGAATAATLVQAGVKVHALDLGSAIAKSEKAPGVEYIPTDVTDPDSVHCALDRAARHEAAPLRVVVSCAGIAPSARIVGKSGVHNLGLYTDVIRVNLIGTFNVMALAAERMTCTAPLEDGQRGVIVNTASIAAYDGQIGQAAYASSKAGVVGLTLPAARDLSQYGIRVATIAPGIVETPMLAAFPQNVRDGLAAGVPFPRRLARPEEYAQLVLTLITHDYLNGEVIRMDGALRMAPR